MTHILKLGLPLPPTTNHSHYGAGGGYRRNSRTKQYHATVTQLVTDAWYQTPQIRDIIPIYDLVEVVVYVKLPDNRKRDISNLEKQLLDALTRAEVWNDDQQVKRLCLTDISTTDTTVAPGCYVEIRPIEKGASAHWTTIFKERQISAGSISIKSLWKPTS